MRKYFVSLIVFLISLLIALLLIIPKNLSDCWVIGDQWFNSKITFDQSSIPEGMQIILTSQEYQTYSLINNNEEPFYLLNRFENTGIDYAGSDLPSELRPEYKLVKDRTYIWSFDAAHKTGWIVRDADTDSNEAISVPLVESAFIIDGEYKQVYADDRPVDVKVPDPQKFTIPAFYKDQPYEITGNYIFSLNENYRPHVVHNSNCNSNRPFWIVVFPSLIIVILGGALSIFVYKKLKKPK
jgi:hypothetical protein